MRDLKRHERLHAACKRGTEPGTHPLHFLEASRCLGCDYQYLRRLRHFLQSMLVCACLCVLWTMQGALSLPSLGNFRTR
jgi:hypothetical protein